MNVSTKVQRIAKLAEQIPGALNNLAHHIDIDWLREAFKRTPEDRAPGVDGQTAQQYAEDLEENLQGLLNRTKSGTYRAPAVRGIEIPKNRHETRPIGIPTLEDKVLQRAVAMVLEPIYEHDFLDCSWGFRPGRSAHQALASLRSQAMEMNGGWVVDLDIRRFFDTLDHKRLGEILRHRVSDGVLLRLIGKWLKAGILREGQLVHRATGTPQGGVISPLLANVYLHQALDTWFEWRIRPTLRGRAHLLRYADDAVLMFEQEADARRVLALLEERLAGFGLALHPDKTRLVDFRMPRAGDEAKKKGALRRSFDFLGFTHYWTRSRRGRWVVKQKTAKDRFSRATRAANEWCRRHRHLPVRVQHRLLSRKLQGHFSYYGITGNSPALARLHHEVGRIWRKWLDRRSNRARMNWERFNRLLERYPLPPPKAVHSIYCRPANP